MLYPPKTANLHYEMELVVVLGKGGRDLQGEAKKQGRPWEVGKAFDLSAPLGPIHPRSAVGTPDEYANVPGPHVGRHFGGRMRGEILAHPLLIFQGLVVAAHWVASQFAAWIYGFLLSKTALGMLKNQRVASHVSSNNFRQDGLKRR
ncbi:hypothetical protein L527_2117 [Bordetella bronchiseptica MBORD839]|uniref:Uncharacterized protein n=1 Tax=Bordetella bronchiseptica 00-P-2796 TaxID=1331199 RepID=A0ABR4RCH3_BORBO|nr:hypothetical protein L490_1895 [Bordetella bronchiseptica 00-P-2796]KDD39428.1 hypothetical protein L527_2117 [Bordetella bronchiseptica MBORD839]